MGGGDALAPRGCCSQHPFKNLPSLNTNTRLSQGPHPKAGCTPVSQTPYLGSRCGSPQPQPPFLHQLPQQLIRVQVGEALSLRARQGLIRSGQFPLLNDLRPSESAANGKGNLLICYPSPHPDKKNDYTFKFEQFPAVVAMSYLDCLIYMHIHNPCVFN